MNIVTICNLEFTYSVDCMLMLDSLPMRDARVEWSIFSLTRLSLFWNEKEFPNSAKTKYITIYYKIVKSIYLLKYYGFNVISVSRGQSCWYLISSHHGTSQCWAWYSWGILVVNTWVAVTSDVLTQLVDLQCILLGCYVRYSTIIQVH